MDLEVDKRGTGVTVAYRKHQQSLNPKLSAPMQTKKTDLKRHIRIRLPYIPALRQLLLLRCAIHPPSGVALVHKQRVPFKFYGERP